MINVILDNVLTMEFNDATPNESKALQQNVIPFIKSQLTFENPEYVNAIRIGAYITKELREKQFIVGWTLEENGSIKMPRAFWHRLSRRLTDAEVGYKVIDNRVTRKSRQRFKYEISVKLRPYQIAATKRAVDIGEGMIIMPCGSGKTQVLTEIIRKMNQWTIVLVHTDDLLTQMKTRLERALGIKVGVVKQDTFDIQPVTVASIATLYRRGVDIVPEDAQDRSGGVRIIERVPNKGGPRKAAIWRSESFYKMWGMVLIDEAHHAPANSIHTVVSRFHARYRIGCTATERRRDNLEGLMFSTVGYRIFSIEHKELYEAGYLMRAEVERIETTFDFFNWNRRQYPRLLKELCANEERNGLVVSRILKEPKEYHLVLSGRIDHLKLLYEELIRRNPKIEKKARLLIGEMDGKTRDEVIEGMRKGDIHYIFATQLADEGLDIPNLSRVHLPFPSRAEGKVLQQCGRTQRPSPGKKRAVVCDYVDTNVRVLMNQAEERLRVYKTADYEIKPITNNPARRGARPFVYS